jgi:HEAT repeat protein
MAKVPFARVLDALQDSSTAFPHRYLKNFIDLEPGDIKALKAVWPQIPVTRKHQLVKDLEKMGADDTLASLDAFARAMLDDPHDQVRLFAIRMLWESNDPRLAGTLIRIMQEDPSEEVRGEAASVLGGYVYQGELDEIPTQLLKDVEDGLLATAHQEQHRLAKRFALEALGYSSRPEVTALIKNAFSQHDPQWVASALFAMGRSADPEQWQADVLYALDHDNLEIRLAAVEAAGELSLESARPALLAALDTEEDNEEIYRAIIWSLSQIGGEDVQIVLYNLADATQDDDLAEFIEEALENLTFTDDLERYDLLAFNPEEPEE